MASAASPRPPLQQRLQVRLDALAERAGMPGPAVEVTDGDPEESMATRFPGRDRGPAVVIPRSALMALAGAPDPDAALDAAMAHELSHLRRGPGTRLLRLARVTATTTGAGLLMLLDGVLTNSPAVVLLALAAIGLTGVETIRLRRCFQGIEFAADAFAARLVDPAAMADALVSVEQYHELRRRLGRDALALVHEYTGPLPDGADALAEDDLELLHRHARAALGPLQPVTAMREEVSWIEARLPSLPRAARTPLRLWWAHPRTADRVARLRAPST